MSRKDKKTVLAGGAVVRRVRPGKDAEILIIHRDRYKDWTLPKGKVEAGESVVAAAAREVREETGVTIRLQSPLDTVLYPLSSGATKEVRYWSGQPLEVIKRAPDDEVDVVSWLPVKAALHRLTFEHDKELVRQHLEQPATTTLVLVRHGKAMDRKDWSKKDTLRPLGARGRKQARQLVPFLTSYGIENLISSTSARCLTTLEPYAGQRRDRRRDPRHPDRGDRDGRPGSRRPPDRQDPGGGAGLWAADRDLRAPTGAARDPGGAGAGAGQPRHR